jgi:hypothetical protein
MRLLILLAVLALGLAACGGSGTSKNTVKITLGITGGNIAPFKVVIAPGGEVRYTGTPPFTPATLRPAQDARLSKLALRVFPALKAVLCPRTNPDVASGFITVGSKTVTVHGNCDPAFTRLWTALNAALAG